MKGRTASLILSILIYAALLVPAGSAESGIKALLMTIIFRLPVFFIVLFLNLTSGSLSRRARGWKPLDLIDWILTPILVLLTLGLGVMFSPHTPPAVYAAGTWPLLVVLTLLIAVIEEGFFRSWLLTELPRLGIPVNWSLLLSCLMFSAVHAWQGIQGVVFAALVAVLYGAVFLWRKNLIVLIIAHTVYNLLAMLWPIIR